MKFTADMKRFFIDSKGIRCPVCEEMGVEEQWEGEDEATGRQKKEFECPQCRQRWATYSELVDVELL
jgi:transcriptional regulator NrdR family protein